MHILPYIMCKSVKHTLTYKTESFQMKSLMEVKLASLNRKTNSLPKVTYTYMKSIYALNF